MSAVEVDATEDSGNQQTGQTAIGFDAPPQGHPDLDTLALAARSGDAGEVPDQFFASVAVNGDERGVFLVTRYADGEFAMREEDLETIGIGRSDGDIVMIEGETNVMLSTMQDTGFVFDERSVHIDIEVDASILTAQVVDARRRTFRNDVEYPRDTSAFFNYGLSDDSGELGSTVFAAEVGARHGSFLFTTDGFYERLDDSDRTVRLNSSITYDNRDTLQQAILGDFVTGSGALGSPLNMGGISFSKNFRIDPYFIRFPFASHSGLATSPSQFDVLVNGSRISSGRLEPGPYEITNIQGPTGVSDVQVIVRDALGREQIYSSSFYFTQEALRKGLSEYNFALGAQRRRFGEESNDYGSLAATGLYRYGISDFLTLGGRAEADDDVFNLGPSLTWLTGRSGLFNTTLSYSRDSTNDGYAGIFDYAIQSRRFNVTASVLAQSRDYARIGTNPSFNTRIEGAGSFTTGPITLRYATSQPYRGTDREAYSVSYRPRTQSPRLSLVTTLRHVEAEESTTEFFFGLNYYFHRDYSLATSVRARKDEHRVTAAVQKTTPIGQGWGFSAAASQFDTSEGSGHSIRPFAQYNSRYATLIADYQSVTIGDETRDSRRLAIQGSVSAVGGEVMLSRPINDAFALVKVDGLENVNVYQSGQFSGKTDSKGRLLIPSLGSYVHNQISVDNRDVPLNYEVRRFTRLTSPALRAGAVLDFEAKRIQAVAGTLNVRADGEILPLRYGEIELMLDGEQVRHPVGQTGEFFIEDLPPSTYTLSYFGDTGTCSLILEVPASEEQIIELGDLLCSPE